MSFVSPGWQKIQEDTGDAPAALARSTRIAARALGCSGAVLAIEQGGRLMATVCSGMQRMLADALLQVAGGCVAERPIVVPDVRHDPRFAALVGGPAPLPFHFAAWVALPARHRATRGVLLLVDPRPRPAGGDEPGLLVELAEMVAEALAACRVQPGNPPGVDPEAQRFKALVEANAQVVWVADAEGEVREVTHMWEALTGQTAVQIQRWGWLRAIVPEDRDRLREAWQTALRQQQPFEATFRILLRGGRPRWYDLRAVPIRNDDGTFREFVGRFADAHERHEARQKIRENEERLRLAFEASRMGMWEWDFEQNRVVLSSVAYELLGVTPETFSFEAWSRLEYIHPDDRDTVREHGKSGLHDGAFELTCEHRTCAPPGQERWLRSISRVFRDETGTPVRLIGTLVDITVTKTYEAGLVEAKERAEDMVRLRDAFLANMSHEIRTPLTAILGFTSLLREEIPPELREYAELIEIGGVRLRDTLTAVLELAQLNAGLHDVRPAPVDVAQVAREVAAAFRAEADRKGLTLDVSVPDAMPVALAERAGLGRVLEHLLSNALKFTRHGGVHVEVEAGLEAVAVHVRDTGRGISPQFLPYLFSEFRQESTGLSRGYEGAGLGLAVAHRLATLMGGTLTVESEQERGSTFTVSLPVARPEAAAGVAG